jgi:hypothetical protein
MGPPDAHWKRMDHTRIDDDQTAERYVMGRLSEEEHRLFEEHFIDCPRCLEAIDSIKGFRDALRDVSAAGVPAAREPNVTKFRRSERRARPFVFLLAAACVSLGILSALFFTQTRAAREELAGSRQLLQETQKRQSELEGELGRERAEGARVAAHAAESLKAAPVFMLNLTRSASSDEGPEDRVVLPEEPGWVTLVFDRPERREVREYRVRISATDGRPIGEAAPARAASGGLLAVSLSSERLPAGDYVLEVEGVSGGEVMPLARYRFRAVAKP